MKADYLQKQRKVKDRNNCMTSEKAINCLETAMKWQNGFTKVTYFE